MVKKEFAGDWSGYLQVGMRIGDNERSIQLSQQRPRVLSVARTRRLFCQIAVSKLGYSGAEVARFPGVTTSAMLRAAKTQELKEVQKYL